MMTKIINGRIIKDGKITEGELCFADGKILCPSEAEKLGEADQVIDAKGNHVSAGFIDLHLHGGGGYDFLDGTEEAFEGAAAFHAKHGTTAMCPTATSGEFEAKLFRGLWYP